MAELSRCQIDGVAIITGTKRYANNRGNWLANCFSVLTLANRLWPDANRVSCDLGSEPPSSCCEGNVTMIGCAY